ncbi:MAG TPA: hypothetical protein VMY42_18290 [Thermoguttaceae bacterium]|nr:hypothetical protein [Thermoguttaceae bacterium]
MMLLRIDKDRHWIPPQPVGEVGRWLRAEFPNHRDLFIYFHRRAGTWVVAMWMQRDVSAKELYVLGPQPVLTPTGAERLQRLVHQPLMWNALRQQITAEERASVTGDAEEALDRKEAMRRLVRDLHPGAGGGRKIGRAQVSGA